MTRWFLHYHRNELDVNALLEHYEDAFAGYRKGVGAFLPDEARTRLDERASTLEKHEIPAPWARLLAGLPYWYRALDMIALARAHRKPWEEVARRHFLVERRLELDWVRERIETLPVAGHWQATARIGLREELYRQQRRLADALLAIEARDPDEAYERWAAERAGRLEHFARVLLDMKASSSVDYAALSVAVQELHKIA
jgi:glutamate dehydrogenase